MYHFSSRLNFFRSGSVRAFEKRCEIFGRQYFNLFLILIYRYHNDRMINYDTDRGVIVTKDKTGSTMSLKNASSGDSGNYTCVPYNIRAASVLVHVLSEGNSAAQLSNSAVSGQRGKLKRV